MSAVPRLWRNPAAVVLTAPGLLRILIVPDRLITLRGEDAALAERLLTEAAGEGVPVPEGNARAAQLAAALADHGALVAEGSAGPVPQSGGAPAPLPPLRVVYGITGAIDCVRAPAYLEALRRRGVATRIVMTASACRLIAPDGLRVLCGAEVRTELFAGAGAAHIELGHWADVIAVVPATAAFLCRLAAGGYSDLLATAIAAAPCPVVLVPAMNPRMWGRRAVQRALAHLAEEGFDVVLPGPGREVAMPHSPRGFGGAGAEPSTLPALLRLVARRAGAQV